MNHYQINTLTGLQLEKYIEELHITIVNIANLLRVPLDRVIDEMFLGHVPEMLEYDAKVERALLNINK
jgi:hypothetical protein